MNKICILGAGSWGTAVASLLSQNGHHIKLWCREPEIATDIKQNGTNSKYLSGVTLSSLIEPVTDLKEALCGANFVFEAIPVKFLRSVLMETTQCFSPNQIFVILSKGIEETLMLPSQIIDDVYGYNVKKVILSGPSYARDLAEKQITAVTIAAQDCATAQEVQHLIATSHFRPYISLDLIGAQVGGALKNVIALAIGILDGAGYGDNVKAYILTRGLNELVQLSQALGGKQETIYGLSGVGDLVLTSMGKLSKNVAAGKEIGKGKTLNEISESMGNLPEGINTVQSVQKLISQHQLDLPICTGVYQIIFNNQKIEDFLQSLMNRPLKPECDL
jgi:glycerol-3-phosphate dehydrogenase (NAD(P)+)